MSTPPSPSYPPIEIPTFNYVYPLTPSTVAEYLRMTTSSRERRPTQVEADESDVWDALGDFA